jgi:hypothetical protein
MALDTQGFFTLEPGMVIIVSAFAGMTTRAGQHLAGAWVKYAFADGMGKRTMQTMAIIADIIDRSFEHCRVVGTMGRMTVVAGVCLLMFVFCCIISFQGCVVARTTDITFFPLEKSLIITGMRGMAGNTAVIFETNQVIVG